MPSPCNITALSNMKKFCITVICALLTTLAQAQTPKPLPGYTYKVDGAVPGKQVYISGQRPFNANGDLIGAGDLSAQMRQVFENLKTALATVGLTLRDIKQVTYHIKGADGPINASAVQQVNQVGGAFFGNSSPQLSTIKAIPQIVTDEVLVEVEAIAYK